MSGPLQAAAIKELWRQRDIWPFELGVQIARLYGRLLARIAEGSVQHWFAVAEPRLRAAAPDERKRAIAVVQRFDRLLPVADALLTGVQRRWIEREAAQIAVRRAEAGQASQALSGATQLSILFCDLKDFTAFADRQGDGAAVRIIDEFASTVMRERGEEAGLTKLLGDGFMLVYPEPRPAVEASKRIIEAMDAWQRDCWCAPNETSCWRPRRWWNAVLISRGRAAAGSAFAASPTRSRYSG